MKRLKLLGVALVAVCAMGLMATSAFALPDVSITLCTGACVYPLHINYNNETVKTKLENVNGGVLSGEGLHLLNLNRSVIQRRYVPSDLLKGRKRHRKMLQPGSCRKW